MKPILAGLVVVLVGCGSKKNAPPAPTPKPTPTPFSLKGEVTGPDTILFDRDGSGKRLLEISGGKVDLQPGTRPIGILGTRATLYREGIPALLVTAKSVHYDTTLEQLRAEGGVMAKSLDKVVPNQFQCDTLSWHPKTKTIVGEGNVVAHYGTLGELYGSRLDTDLQLKTLDLLP